MIQIDPKSRLPIYEQLIENIKNLIIIGGLKKDEQLPSVRNLSIDLTINPNTIQKAYKELERQGYIYTIRGRGNFVSSNEDIKDLKKIDDLIIEFKKIVLELTYMGLSQNELMKELVNAVDKVKEGGE